MNLIFTIANIWTNFSLYFTNLQLPSNISWAQTSTQPNVPVYSKAMQMVCPQLVDMNSPLSFLKKEGP